MTSPLDSSNGDGSTAMWPTDPIMPDLTDRDLNDSIVVQMDSTKTLLPGGWQSPEASLSKSAPDDRIKTSEIDNTVIVTTKVEETEFIQENSHTKVFREHVSVDTLRTYCIGHYIDQEPEYVIITRRVPEYEMEFLKRHTQELHKGSVIHTQAQKPNDPLFSRPFSDEPKLSLQLEASNKPDLKVIPQAPLQLNTKVPPAQSENQSAESGTSWAATPITANKPPLLLQTNYIPFEKWSEPWTKTNRGKSVLDVAMMQRKATSEDLHETSTVPVRLAMNSVHIRFNFTTAVVMHPPWKFIVNYYEKIKECQKELEKQLEEESSKDSSKENEQADPNIAGKDFNKVVKTTSEVAEKNRSLARPPSPPPACEVCSGPLYSSHPSKLQCLREAVEHFRFFVDFIDNDLKHVFELRRGLADCTVREIAFEDLWHLFSPGDLMITSGLKRERQCYRIFYTSGGRPMLGKGTYDFEKSPVRTAFKIDCYYINYDSRWLGPIHESILIPRFESKCPITSLSMTYVNKSSLNNPSAFPIRFLEDHETAVTDLVKRGKRLRELTPFSELTPFAHKRYCGPSSVARPEYSSEATNPSLGSLVNKQVLKTRKLLSSGDKTVINKAFLAYKDLSFERMQHLFISGEEEDHPLIGKFESVQVNPDEVPEGCSFQSPCFGCRDVVNDNVIDRQRADKYKQDLNLLSVRDANDDKLTDEHCLLLPPHVRAFVLRERDIFRIYVDLVQDLDGDHGESLKTLKKQSGFEDLVLPDGHSDLVEALVRTHRSTAQPKDGEAKEKIQVDLIDGKGEGLVILLHGVPGVGKTSTAECVAAYTGRPLYPITCANIGLDPEEVEENLTGEWGHFRRAQQWNCVILLDEADVFLAKRETRDNDAKRNSLVSVFLRTLEYYSGILILTTNRVGAFDEAVISRIQLFLYYPPLDKEKTLKVWRVHINRVRASGLINIDYEDEATIMDFAEGEYEEGRRWNGRQIRNFFQTAISLATYDAARWRQQSIEDGRLDKESEADKPRLTTRTLKIVAATSGKFIDYINSTVPDGSHQKQQLDEGNRNDNWEETPKKKK